MKNILKSQKTNKDENSISAQNKQKNKKKTFMETYYEEDEEEEELEKSE